MPLYSSLGKTQASLSKMYGCCGQGYTRRSSLSWAIPILYHCFTRHEWVNSSLNELKLHPSYPVQIIQLFLNIAWEHQYQDSTQHKMGEEQTNSAEEGYPLLFYPSLLLHQHLFLPPSKSCFKVFPVFPLFPAPSEEINHPQICCSSTPSLMSRAELSEHPHRRCLQITQLLALLWSPHRLRTKTARLHPRWL